MLKNVKIIAIDGDPKNPSYSKDCLETIKLNHSNVETIHANILDVENSLGSTDIAEGGVPCPEFSNAKTDKTYDDTLLPLPTPQTVLLAWRVFMI